MKFFDDPIFRILLFPFLLISSLFWLFFANRFLSIPFLFCMIGFYILQFQNGKGYRTFIFLLLFLGSTFLPADISFQDYPGSPRFVPVVMGNARRETGKKARRGERWLGGCVVSGYEPRYMWVW
jgi:hypothetical protein